MNAEHDSRITTPGMWLDGLLVLLAILFGLALCSLTDHTPVEKHQPILTGQWGWQNGQYVKVK